MSNINKTTQDVIVGDKTLSLETGWVAKQADGSVIARMGDTMVLATAVSDKVQKPGISDFVPLTVNYKERTYAAGKIPGGFFKRESRASKKETLASRIIDRSLRPLFPSGYTCETNVTAMVLSADGVYDTEVLAVMASSTALIISSIPFTTPVAAVRIGRLNGNFIVNPTLEEQKSCDMDLIISGSLEGMLMVEGGAKEVSEEDVIKALETAKPAIDILCKAQLELKEKAGKEKFSFQAETVPQDVVDLGNNKYRAEVANILNAFYDKQTRDVKIAELKAAFAEEIKEAHGDNASTFAGITMENLSYEESRKLVLEKGVRVDGRKTDEIRQLNSITGLLPRAHGSALFTRGQTQGLVVTTLGTSGDAQLVESLEESYDETFMLHYNFPGFSTGECKPDRAPGRREIGHGELARRALLPLIPDADKFPYTIRVVSDIMESNGSSSMASVCGGSLSLFDAGVPMKAACSGIAMGLIKEGDKYAVLSDIMGLEDHLGDMDFKLTGSRNGITAFQMDVKLAGGISIEILKEAVAQATKGRMHIMDHMDSVLPEPRKDVSKFAPVIYTMRIPQDKIGALIGPGGKNIKRITETTDTKIDINDDGVVQIAAVNGDKLAMAKAEIELLTAEVELNKIYKGKVVSIQPFGAFVELIPGKDGLLHISEIDKKRINKVEDVLKMGDIVEVKVVEIDNNGKVRLSRKVLL
ncbi:Polyribonucleotide nucleotidyltransferase [Elusimicrobium minutum Pei191]|uniref:Polyribonucleotide nucleotidyltransferase n=1 Tax=Elusimicrobium minutum (strain Pei191) TaxID=445932 RepID=PNP_ELUMP|nr:polyribonucleotide nucleotidyltransferase [Elusimicrobium minutum]B2KDX2.1 RecName: Full=Polyribonucleotide nucleotidyltransferase; AltName: Full=Polynucleotide phosphorylase; Short=PNPase [Elusimicrobium minutum Pei191]ACC98718.1 Polyribonucleotide nucleotidyltransferase [Elusimicrobium minutum Pei191]